MKGGDAPASVAATTIDTSSPRPSHVTLQADGANRASHAAPAPAQATVVRPAAPVAGGWKAQREQRDAETKQAALDRTEEGELARGQEEAAKWLEEKGVDSLEKLLATAGSDKERHALERDYHSKLLPKAVFDTMYNGKTDDLRSDRGQAANVFGNQFKPKKGGFECRAC